MVSSQGDDQPGVRMRALIEGLTFTGAEAHFRAMFNDRSVMRPVVTGVSDMLRGLGARVDRVVDMETFVITGPGVMATWLWKTDVGIQVPVVPREVVRAFDLALDKMKDVLGDEPGWTDGLSYYDEGIVRGARVRRLDLVQNSLGVSLRIELEF